MKKKIGVAIAVIVVLVGGAMYYIHYKASQKPALALLQGSHSKDPAGYVGFTNDSLNTVLPGTTSVLLAPHSSLHYALTLFSPSNSQGARIQITDVVTGRLCDTPHYLVERVYVATDEKTAQVYYYNGSTHYVDTIDMTTCKTVAPTQTLQ